MAVITRDMREKAYRLLQIHPRLSADLIAAQAGLSATTVRKLARDICEGPWGYLAPQSPGIPLRNSYRRRRALRAMRSPSAD
jgi:hypothetical protein